MGDDFREGMEKYKKVPKSSSSEEKQKHVVHVTQKGKVRGSVSYILSLFQEEGLSMVVIKGTGNAVSNAVSVVDIVKRRLPGIEESIELCSVEFLDTYEPLEEGLDTLHISRRVAGLTITLLYDQETSKKDE